MIMTERKPANKPSVWVINTHNAGDLRCGEGIARKINPDFSIQYIQGKSPEQIARFYKETFQTTKLKHARQWPDFVVSSGSPSAEAARTIKRLSGGRTFIIQNLNPKERFNEFDLMAIPQHRIKDEHKSLRNCLTTIGVPHGLSEQKIEEARAAWTTRFSHLPEPKIAVLLGGHIKTFPLTPARAQDLARKLNAKAKELGGSLIVTTSRRTDSAISKAFFDEISVPSYIHDWSKTGVDNPYMGILGCADAIVATGDSVSMCCEASTSRKPVYVYSFDGARRGLKTFHKQLYDHELAKPFEDLIRNGVVPWEYEPLDTAGFVANEALLRWKSVGPKQQAELVVNNSARRIIDQRCLEIAGRTIATSADGLTSLKSALQDDKTFQREFLRAVHMIGSAQRGRVLITGVGKSLRVGELAAASLGSLSIPCEILDPTHAVHGDLGKMQLNAGDTLIAISKSGNSEELKPVVEEAERRGLNIISMTHNEDSFLGKAAKKAESKGILLKLPDVEEPHPFLNAEGTRISPPTGSTTQVKALFEAIGLAVARSRGMEVEHFQTNHPAGALGKRRSSSEPSR
jgi:mitochondrial fission protein ELM1/D-arabinose 5-phosphate isomerase GutQ